MAQSFEISRTTGVISILQVSCEGSPAPAGRLTAFRFGLEGLAANVPVTPLANKVSRNNPD
jgi:hypothetical protein